MNKSFSPITCFSLFFLFLFSLFSNSLQAAELSFGWSPNTEPNLAGYKIHYGTASRTYSMSIDVGNPPIIDGKVTRTLTVFPREETLYYFSATAYDVNGFESDYSTEVVVDISAETSDTEAVFLFITEGFPQEDISAVEETGLLKIWQVQKLSRDLYHSFYTAYSSTIYANMLSDAQHHMDFLHILLGKYGIAFPQDIAGIFTDQDVQNLYNIMLNTGNGSAVDALRMGATAEDMIIDELQTRIVETDCLEILLVYQNFAKTARNHLRFYINELSQTGIDYAPQYISEDDFTTIMAAPVETDIYDENGNVSYANGEWLVTATQVNANQIDLTWTDPTPLVDAALLADPSAEIVFRIERSTNGEAYMFLASVSADARSYSDITVVEGNTYQYRIFAVDVTGDSLGVFRNGLWLIDSNGNDLWEDGTDDSSSFGLATDTPIAGDWNGDGHTETGFYRNGSFYLDMNGNGTWDGESTDKIAGSFPNTVALGDIPVVGDWNNDGITDIGVSRNIDDIKIWILDMNGNGIYDGNVTDRRVIFGKAGDIPVVGDWNGAGFDKIGVYRDSLWILDINGNGIYEGSVVDYRTTFGKTGDIPMAGDWDGSGTDKIGVYRDGLWILDKNGNGIYEGQDIDLRLKNFIISSAGDVPVVGRW